MQGIPMDYTPRTQLLDAFPHSRARTIADAREEIGRTFSPHRLDLLDRGEALEVRHNQVRLRQLSLNTLTYGASVLIDPGQRGDFYMVQLPLAGHARLVSGHEEAEVNRDVLSVLQPRARCRMYWGENCSMILVKVPREAVERRASEWGLPAKRHVPLCRSRREPAIGAWWQAAVDLTVNFDRHGTEWLRHRGACDAMEEFLLSTFTSMLSEPAAQPAAGRSVDRSVRRAKEYIHGHLDRALTLDEIARHASCSPRTLEAAFKRSGEPSPLSYARGLRLTGVHRALCDAADEGRRVSITEVAMAHGFMHLGRFAAQYRAQFGCPPSQTLRLH